VSAREKIIGLIGGQSPASPIRGIAERVADEILAEYAHELAEQIRAHSASLDAWGSGFYSVGGLGEAADLIDPEVS
jgi:hypothetical protein